MKELLLYMAKNLVDDPDAVSVTEVDDEDGKVLELRVAPGDMEFQHLAVLVFDFGNGNCLRIIHQILCHIQQKFFHCGITPSGITSRQPSSADHGQCRWAERRS